MFIIDNTYGKNIKVKAGSREFVNLDIPNTYYNGIKVICGKYGVLTVEFTELPESDKKEVVKFMINSWLYFYKWTKKWKNPIYGGIKDAENGVLRIFKNTFGEGIYLNEFKKLYKKGNA